jgi:hypothetical protein
MKKIFLRLYVVILGVVLAACLDDDKYALDPEGSTNVIEFLDPSVPASPSGSIYPAYATSYTLAPSAQFDIQVSFSGPVDENNNNIELQLAVDPIALAEYNKHMTEGLYGEAPLGGSVYELMPEENYDLASTTVTIPSGQSKATVSLNVFPELFDFSKNYAIPLRIVSASHGTLSSHYSVAILAIGVRNIYDGVYEIIGGTITRNSATGPDVVLGGTYDEGLTLDLTTLSSNSLGIEPVWKDGSGIGGIGGTSLTINEATGDVTVKSSTNATLKNTPATINHYDAATKTFELNFDWGNAPNTRIIANWKLQYVGPRP